jgi:hypothetical protein
MITSFSTSKESIDEYITTKNNNIFLLNVLVNKPKCELSDFEIKDIVILKDVIKDLEEKINNISSNKEELEYFVNTSDILYNYYDLLENNTDEGGIPIFNNNNNNNNTNINNSNDPNTTIAHYFTQGNKDDLEKICNKNTKTSRYHLLDDYLSYTDKNYINNNLLQENASVCSYCKGNVKDILINEGIICCRNCYTIEHIITDNENPSYKDPPKEISYFSYKRINHFSEWLNQIQGKETTDIPDEVFNKIMLELNKQRIYNLATITPLKIREILKKHRINKYYEHIPYILNKITNIPNPHLNPELEEKLKNMFKEIQVPFLKYSPNNRKNFLSYSYVLHKFIQILDQLEFLKYFPLLKSRDKLHQQEQIWKKICEDIGWKFIRSI